ncbi:MAG: response regulator, partial [Pseudomonadota bacterium]|nr:response regulator [Pseudomonadota bacterium]
FVLTLPVDRATAYPGPAPGAVLPSHAEGFDGLPVLVIDNEPAALESMQVLLERWGCEVVTASSKAAALAQMASGARVPAVILADYHLDHELTGYDAIHAVRRHLGQDIPAAVITADRSDDTRRLLRAQYLPILNKPVKPNRLRALITSLITPSSTL